MEEENGNGKHSNIYVVQIDLFAFTAIVLFLERHSSVKWIINMNKNKKLSGFDVLVLFCYRYAENPFFLWKMMPYTKNICSVRHMEFVFKAVTFPCYFSFSIFVRTVSYLFACICVCTHTHTHHGITDCVSMPLRARNSITHIRFGFMLVYNVYILLRSKIEYFPLISFLFHFFPSHLLNIGESAMILWWNFDFVDLEKSRQIRKVFTVIIIAHEWKHIIQHVPNWLWKSHRFFLHSTHTRVYDNSSYTSCEATMKNNYTFFLIPCKDKIRMKRSERTNEKKG